MMTMKLRNTYSLFSLFAGIAISLFLFAPTAEAQVRSQGKVLGESDKDKKPTFTAPLVDYAGEMRKLIRKVARYGRRYKRDFIVLVKDGNGLLSQVVDVDLLLEAPSSTYINALDGVIQPNLSFGSLGYGAPNDKKEKEEMLKDLKIAREAGLTVFTLDHVSKPADVDKAFRLAQKNKFIPYAAPGAGIRNNKLPKWPRTPTNENARSITNIQQVKNYLFLNDSSRFGSRDEFAMKIHNTNYDMVVTSVFHHRFTALSKNNIRTMQFKKLGARRPVLAKMNIGFADVGKYYWQDNWRQGNPGFILELAPQSSDQYLVQYWNPAWQQVMFGNDQSYLYGIIKQGFDGVVIEGVYVHQLFENPE